MAPSSTLVKLKRLRTMQWDQRKLRGRELCMRVAATAASLVATAIW
jgi:hypothetical protein